jgi:hypothetical protein
MKSYLVSVADLQPVRGPFFLAADPPGDERRAARMMKRRIDWR